MPAKRMPAPSAIRQLDRAFMKSIATRDARSLAVLMPPNHEAVKGRPNIEKFLQGLMDAGVTDVTLKTTKIESAGDLAYGRGAYSFALPAADGSMARDVGKYVVVYRRARDGSWKAIADIFNSDRPAA